MALRHEALHQIEKVGYAFNVQQQAFLATRLRIAEDAWSRLVGLLTTPLSSFSAGEGLLLRPSHGIHTFGMRYPIDVICLDAKGIAIEMRSNLRPWKFGPMCREACAVLELPVFTIVRTGTNLGDRIEITGNSKKIHEYTSSEAHPAPGKSVA